MIDPREMRWIEEHATGDVDHLLLGTSLPLFLTPALHHVEAWNEAVCDGAWGRVAAWVGEKIRQGADLEHWAAFGDSFESMCRHIREVGTGQHGEPPATIVALSGDVHHAYLAEVAYRRGTGMRSQRLAGGLLAVPQPARPQRAPDDARRRLARGHRGRAAARPQRARRAAVGALALRARRAVVRQPGRDARAARAASATFQLEKSEPPPGPDGRLKLERVFEHRAQLTAPSRELKTCFGLRRHHRGKSEPSGKATHRLTRTDAELLLAARQDPTAFREFYDRYAVWMRAWLLRQTGSESAALDLTAETFAQAWHASRRFKDMADGSGAPWLFGIARNLVRQYHKHNRIETAARERLGLPLAFAECEDYERVDERITAHAMGPALKLAMRALPKEQRRALELRIIEQLDYEEVAGRLGCSQNAARLRVSRGLRALTLSIRGAEA